MTSRPFGPLLSLTLLASAWACDDPDPVGSLGGGETEAAALPTPRERAGESSPSGASEAIELTTSDGVIIHGTLRRGGSADAPAVVLVHQLGATRAEWAPIVELLSRAPGLTTLAIDMRGHGESVVGPEGIALSHHSFENADWAKTELDVRAALAHLTSSATLTPRALGVAGSSIGSTAAIAAAATDDRVRAVVALSPGRAYRGFDALTPASRLSGREVLVMAAEGEPPAVETMDHIAQMNTRAERVVLSGAGHGLAMQADNPDMPARVEAFLRRALTVE